MCLPFPQTLDNDNKKIVCAENAKKTFTTTKTQHQINIEKGTATANFLWLMTGDDWLEFKNMLPLMSEMVFTQRRVEISSKTANY